jgi:hypothetical protein
MALCPAQHENPESFAYCKVCGLPLLDAGLEFARLVEVLRSRSAYARPKAWNYLTGIGTIGVKILNKAGILQSNAPLTRAACLAIDTASHPGPESSGTEAYFSLQLGGNESGDAMFCGLGKSIAELDPSLSPLISNSGLREKDENQSIISVMALGGGTASGASGVFMRRIRALNPSCYIFSLAILPGADESLHKHINAYYGIISLLGTVTNPVADAVLAVQYDRLKNIGGVGGNGEELDLEGRLLGLYRLMASNMSVPNSSKFGRLNRWMRTPVLVPCLALGRSIEIFGNLNNILESSIAYPLCSISNDSVIVSELLLSIPQRLASAFPEHVVAENLAVFNRQHFKNLKSSIYQVSYSSEKNDRVNACLLLGGGKIEEILADTLKQFYAFRQQTQDPSRWAMYGLTEEAVTTLEKEVASFFPSS